MYSGHDIDGVASISAGQGPSYSKQDQARGSTSKAGVRRRFAKSATAAAVLGLAMLVVGIALVATAGKSSTTETTTSIPQGPNSDLFLKGIQDWKDTYTAFQSANFSMDAELVDCVNVSDIIDLPGRRRLLQHVSSRLSVQQAVAPNATNTTSPNATNTTSSPFPPSPPLPPSPLPPSPTPPSPSPPIPPPPSPYPPPPPPPLPINDTIQTQPLQASVQGDVYPAGDGVPQYRLESSLPLVNGACAVRVTVNYTANSSTSVIDQVQPYVPQYYELSNCETADLAPSFNLTVMCVDRGVSTCSVEGVDGYTPACASLGGVWDCSNSMCMVGKRVSNICFKIKQSSGGWQLDDKNPAAGAGCYYSGSSFEYSQQPLDFGLNPTNQTIVTIRASNDPELLYNYLAVIDPQINVELTPVTTQTSTGGGKKTGQFAAGIALLAIGAVILIVGAGLLLAPVCGMQSTSLSSESTKAVIAGNSRSHDTPGQAPSKHDGVDALMARHIKRAADPGPGMLDADGPYQPGFTVAEITRELHALKMRIDKYIECLAPPSGTNFRFSLVDQSTLGNLGIGAVARHGLRHMVYRMLQNKLWPLHASGYVGSAGKPGPLSVLMPMPFTTLLQKNPSQALVCKAFNLQREKTRNHLDLLNSNSWPNDIEDAAMKCAFAMNAAVQAAIIQGQDGDVSKANRLLVQPNGTLEQEWGRIGSHNANHQSSAGLSAMLAVVKAAVKLQVTVDAVHPAFGLVVDGHDKGIVVCDPIKHDVGMRYQGTSNDIPPPGMVLVCELPGLMVKTIQGVKTSQPQRIKQQAIALQPPKAKQEV